MNFISKIIDVFQLGYNKFITKEDTFYDEVPRVESSVTSSLNPSNIQSGNMSFNVDLVDGYLQSSNFVTGSTGWQIKSNGDVEFNNGVFRGSITATTIDIGGSDSTSFHVDVNGNMWLGGSAYASAPFKISSAGAVEVGASNNITLTEGGNIKFTFVTAAGACTAALVTTGVGNLTNGDYTYKVTFVNSNGETSMGTVSNTVTVDATHKQVTLSAIPVSASTSVTSRKIYRTRSGVAGEYYLLTTISDNTTTTYADNVADGSLGATNTENRPNTAGGKLYSDGILSFLVSGDSTFLGKYTGSTNGTTYQIVGVGDTLVGSYAGNRLTTGSSNTFVGILSGFSTTTGSNNFFGGDSAGYSNTTGIANVKIGSNAGLAGTTSSYGVYIGNYAGSNETGSNKLYIDNQGRSNEADDRVKALIYGVFDAATANQLVTINGNLGVRTSTFGGSADGVLGLANGTVPSSSPADMVQLFSVDISAGNASLGIRTETAVIVDADETKFSDKLAVKINGTTYYIMLTQT